MVRCKWNFFQSGHNRADSKSQRYLDNQNTRPNTFYIFLNSLDGSIMAGTISSSGSLVIARTITPPSDTLVGGRDIAHTLP